MSKIFTIAGVPYEFPESGADPDWSEKVVAWAEAVTDALGGVSSDGDILTSTFAIANNVSSATNILGFSFDGSIVQGFIAEYSITRTDDTTESGTLVGAYNSGIGTWTMTQTGNNVEATGVTLSITSTGQIQYTSTDVTGTIGQITFRGRGLKI